MVAAIGLGDADNAQIGLHADIARLVPARNLLAALERSSPVAQKRVGSEDSEKRLCIAGVGGFDEPMDWVGRSNFCTSR